MAVHLRLYSGAGAFLGFLPDVQTAEVSEELNEVGSGALTYPRVGRNVDLLLAQNDAQLALVEAGVERFRFLLEDDDDDPAARRDKANKLSLSGRGVLALFERGRVLPQGGVGTTPALWAFTDATPGRILRTLLDANRALGFLAGVTLAFTDTTDSAGAPWAKTMSVQYEAGRSLLDVVLDLGNQGMADFRMVGTTLQMYNPETQLGTDLPAVFVRRGHLRAAPRKRSRRELFSDVIVVGAEGTNLLRSDATAAARYGRRLGYLGQGNASLPATLATLGDAALADHSTPAEGHTLELLYEVPGCPRPYRDFDVGDRIRCDYVPDPAGGYEPLRVRSAALSYTQAGLVAGSLEVNDRFLEATIKLRRRIEGIVHGNVSDTGGAPAPEAPGGIDGVAPRAPTGLAVSSVAYVTARGGIEVAADAAWVAPTANADGTPLTDLDRYQIAWYYASDPSRRRYLDAPGGALTVSFGPLLPDRDVRVEMRALDWNGNASPWTVPVAHRTSADVTPPPVPSTPTVTDYLGVLRIRWGGLGSASEPQPPDFSHVEVHVSTVSEFAPTADTLLGRLPGPGIFVAPNLPYGVPHFVRLRSVDTSGNTSAPGAQATATPSRITRTDISDQAVSTPQLAANAVTAGKIAAASITADKVGLGVFGRNLLRNPSFENLTLDGWTFLDHGGGQGGIELATGAARPRSGAGKAVLPAAALPGGTGASLAQAAGPPLAHNGTDGSASPTTSVTTASFSVPAGALLVVNALYDSAHNDGHTVTVTDSAGLAWNLIGHLDRTHNGGAAGGAYAAWAVSTVARTLTVTTTLGAATSLAVRVLVFTGANTASPIGAVRLAPDFSGVFAESITTTVADSWTWAAVADWDAGSVPAGASGTTRDAGVNVRSTSSNMTASVFRRTSAQPTAGSLETIAVTSPESTSWNVIVYEVKPGAAAPTPTPGSSAHSDPFPVTPGTSYAWLAYLGSGGLATVRFAVSADGSTWTELPDSGVEQVGIAAEYNEYTSVWTAPVGANFARWQLTNWRQGQQTWMTADDVAVIEVGYGAAELSPAGLRLFDEDGDETVSLSSTGAYGNYFSVRKDGVTLSALTTDGRTVSRNSDVAETLTVRGETLEALLDARPRRVLAWGSANPGIGGGTTTSEIGLMELTVEMHQGRLYVVSTNSITLWTDAAPAHAQLRLRYTRAPFGQVCPQPTLTSPLFPAGAPAPITANGERGWSKIDTLHTPLASETYRWLLTLTRVTGTGSVAPRANAPVELYVTDHGPHPPETGILTDGTAATTQRGTYTREYPAAWSQAYTGSGAQRTDVGTEMVTGYYSGSASRGNQRSLLGFDGQLGTDLSGTTVRKVEVYLYAHHWYYGNGGTMVIGAHGATSRPGSYPAGVSTNLLRVAGWPRGAGRWVDITTMVPAQNWATGATRGVSLGPGPSTDPTYYGRITGAGQSQAPRLRVTYSKG